MRKLIVALVALAFTLPGYVMAQEPKKEEPKKEVKKKGKKKKEEKKEEQKPHAS